MLKGVAQKINGALSPIDAQIDENLAYSAEHGKISAVKKNNTYTKVSGEVAVRNPYAPDEEKTFKREMTISSEMETFHTVGEDFEDSTVVHTDMVIDNSDPRISFKDKPIVIFKKHIPGAQLPTDVELKDYIYDDRFYVTRLEDIQQIMKIFRAESYVIKKGDLEVLREVLQDGYYGLIREYWYKEDSAKLVKKDTSPFKQNEIIQLSREIDFVSSINTNRYLIFEADVHETKLFFSNSENEYCNKKLINSSDNNEELGEEALHFLRVLNQMVENWKSDGDENPLERLTFEVFDLTINNLTIHVDTHTKVFISNGWSSDSIVYRYYFLLYDMAKEFAQNNSLSMSFYRIQSDGFYLGRTSSVKSEIGLGRIEEMVERGMLVGAVSHAIGENALIVKNPESYYLFVNHEIQLRGGVSYLYADLSGSPFFNDDSIVLKHNGSKATISNGNDFLKNHYNQDVMEIFKRVGADEIEDVFSKAKKKLYTSIDIEQSHLNFDILAQEFGALAIEEVVHTHFVTTREKLTVLLEWGSNGAQYAKTLNEFKERGFAFTVIEDLKEDSIEDAPTIESIKNSLIHDLAKPLDVTFDKVVWGDGNSSLFNLLDEDLNVLHVYKYMSDIETYYKIVHNPLVKNVALSTYYKTESLSDPTLVIRYEKIDGEIVGINKFSSQYEDPRYTILTAHDEWKADNRARDFTRARTINNHNGFAEESVHYNLPLKNPIMEQLAQAGVNKLNEIYQKVLSVYIHPNCAMSKALALFTTADDEVSMTPIKLKEPEFAEQIVAEEYSAIITVGESNNYLYRTVLFGNKLIGNPDYPGWSEYKYLYQNTEEYDMEFLSPFDTSWTAGEGEAAGGHRLQLARLGIRARLLGTDCPEVTTQVDEPEGEDYVLYKNFEFEEDGSFEFDIRFEDFGLQEIGVPEYVKFINITNEAGAVVQEGELV